MGKLFGGGSTSQTTETSPWKPAQGALENILSQAGQLFDKNGGINAEFIEKEIADLTPEMQQAVKDLVNTDYFKNFAQQGQDAIQQGISGIGQASGLLQGLAQNGITADNINKMAGELYDSDLVASQKEQLSKDIDKSLAKQVQSINSAATGSGSMGSSRAGVAEGVAITGANEALAQGTAAIENSARQNAMSQAIGTLQGNQSTALQGSQALGSMGIGALGQMGNVSNIYNQGLQNQLTGSSILQQYQQGILNNKWFNATGQQNAGWNNLNNYLGIAGTIGGMGGTSTTTGKGSSNAGGAITGMIGSIFQGKSDERLKDNIKMVEHMHDKVLEDGTKVKVPSLYKWDWNALAIKLFAEEGYKVVPPAYGCVAQDLEKEGFGVFVVEHPTDVEGLDGSVKVVNYGELLEYIGLPIEMEMGA